LHTDSLDETLALPSEEAVMIALRTQQIIVEESGVTNTIDPLGGSYYIEVLTNEMEKGAHEYFKKLDDLGGMVSAIEKGFPQNEIRDAGYTYQKEIDDNERIIVGVNKFEAKEEQPIETLKIEPEIEKKQVERLRTFKKNRDGSRINKALEELKKSAESGESVIPPIIKTLKLYATVGEICNTLKEVFGEYKEPGTI
jgi:methylmalonyl-CoA mutase N-terminal domain/subunit